MFYLQLILENSDRANYERYFVAAAMWRGLCVRCAAMRGAGRARRC